MARRAVSGAQQARESCRPDVNTAPVLAASLIGRRLARCSLRQRPASSARPRCERGAGASVAPRMWRDTCGPDELRTRGACRRLDKGAAPCSCAGVARGGAGASLARLNSLRRRSGFSALASRLSAPTGRRSPRARPPGRCARVKRARAAVRRRRRLCAPTCSHSLLGARAAYNASESIEPARTSSGCTIARDLTTQLKVQHASRSRAASAPGSRQRRAIFAQKSVHASATCARTKTRQHQARAARRRLAQFASPASSNL